MNFDNMVRSDKPESPTDCVFWVGSMILLMLWVFATVAGKTIPHILEIIGFLGTCKVIKVANNKVTERKAPVTTDECNPDTTMDKP